MKKFLCSFLTGAFLSFVLVACEKSESNVAGQSQASKPALVRVSVLEVQPTSMKDVLVLPGETRAWEDVRVSSDMDGLVEWIGPKEGQAVRKGELLARIDVAARKAALDRAKASFNLADELFRRRESLFQRSIISKEELDRAATELALAETNLRQAQVEYERGFLKAPISGVVNHLYVDAGEYVARGAPFLDLVNVEKIKIQLNVPEMDVRFLKPGQQALVGIDALPDKRLWGKVDFVAYKADPATKTFQVQVVVDNPAQEIRPGMIARVGLLRREVNDALAVPLFAIVNKGGERVLFVEKDGVASARTVSIGIIEGDRVQITSGLSAGERVIVSGQAEVEEGMQVQVQ
ncbi:MAG: efflux RND transporter periplasmic adaptor subunit [bacterium]